MVLIESIEAKPPVPLVCWASWIDSGGCSATVLNVSCSTGLAFELGVNVGLVISVGIGPDCLLATWLNELKDETATSGDCGERRCAVFVPESVNFSNMNHSLWILGISLSLTAKSFSPVCSFNPFSLSVSFLPLIGDTGVAGPSGYAECVLVES